MTAYLDSSVLLRVLLDQPGKLPEFSRIARAISSKLLKAECLRTLDRLRLGGSLTLDEYSSAAKDFYEAFESIELIGLADAVLDRCAGAFASPLGTLDGIHLSSALLWRESGREELAFCTHDAALGNAAAACGFRVFGI